jgi:metallo-beta-lactamase class B
MKKIILFICLSFAFNADSQVWFRINQVPANTPPDDQLFVAGSFNNWNEANPAFAFTPVQGGVYLLQTQLANGNWECKFTRGSWASVEGTSSGTYLPNRTISVSQGDTIDFSSAGWEDLSSGNNGTALSTVTLYDSDFLIPELNRNRRIWVCLPPDYEDSLQKFYPVIYMHDGQNLFDQTLSFAGEWQIDEHMMELFEEGDRGAIVVGIENGGSARIDEYCPWNNPAYGGGEGPEYASFIKNTLKPHIDANFRTLQGAASTAIAGSSLGALISLYTALEYPEVFGRVGLFSPAFWINRDSLLMYMNTKLPEETQKFYFVAGSNESSSMVSDMNLVYNRLISGGLPAQNAQIQAEADGAHSEWFWSREYQECYLWLFSQNLAPGFAIPENIYPIQFRPNPADTFMMFELPEQDSYLVILLNAMGQEVLRFNEAKGGLIKMDVSALQAGRYQVLISSDSGSFYRGGILIN